MADIRSTGESLGQQEHSLQQHQLIVELAQLYVVSEEPTLLDQAVPPLYPPLSSSPEAGHLLQHQGIGWSCRQVNSIRKLNSLLLPF